MKTTKIFALLLLVGMFQNNSLAQGIYFELNTGYSLSAAPMDFGSNSIENVTNDSYNLEKTIISGSLGKGFELGLKVGYKFSENIGIDLKADYLIGAKYEFEDSYNYTTDLGGDTYVENESTIGDFSANMFRINPALVFELPQSKMKPYARLGVVLGMGQLKGNYTESYSESYSGGFDFSTTSSEEVKSILNGGLSIGSSAEIGVQIGLSDKLSLLAGVKAIGMSFAPKRSEITSYIVDGQEMVSELNTNERETEYVSESSLSGTETTDPNKPSQSLKSFYAFSSVGLSVGLRFSL